MTILLFCAAAFLVILFAAWFLLVWFVSYLSRTSEIAHSAQKYTEPPK